MGGGVAPLGEGVCPGAGGGVPLVAELAGDGAPPVCDGGLRVVGCGTEDMSSYFNGGSEGPLDFLSPSSDDFPSSSFLSLSFDPSAEA